MTLTFTYMVPTGGFYKPMRELHSVNEIYDVWNSGAEIWYIDIDGCYVEVDSDDELEELLDCECYDAILTP